jgi:hypothetical protein
MNRYFDNERFIYQIEIEPKRGTILNDRSLIAQTTRTDNK